MLKMKLLVVLSFLIATLAYAENDRKADENPPNFLVIVADDLGYSDIGAFGGEINTPNIDALAQSGIRFSNFHAAPACSPTRSMLLTGADNHQIGLGTMISPTEEQKGNPGYVKYLTDNATTVAEHLQDAGYATMMAGKWHLGYEREQSPANRGFDHSFVLLQGVASHYGVDQNADLAKFDMEKSHKNLRVIYREDGNLAHYPEGRHSTDVYTEKMISYLDRALDQDKPFFAYMAYTAPHWPLQAPQFYIDKYKGMYDAGPQALREKRLAKMKQLSVVGEHVKPYLMQNVPDWNKLSAEERARESRRMEVYAAMVEHMDTGVGRLLDYLKSRDEFDNTIILFMSDNGAEGMPDDMLKGDPFLTVDNSLNNMGSWDSYFGYGPSWAQASATPFRLYKAYSTEGGIRTPLIVRGKGVGGNGVRGKGMQPNTISHEFLHVTDITPTLLELAGVSVKDNSNKDTVAIRGKSWVDFLAGEASHVYDENDVVGTELFGGRALHRGHWKIVYVQDGYYRPQKAGPGKWQMYDLDKDPGETTDISAQHPQLFNEMIAQWHDYAREAGVVVLWDERKASH